MQKRDLIYRDDLIAAYDAAHKGPPGLARKLMQEAPAVDAAPVVHAHWMEDEDSGDIVCSACEARYDGDIVLSYNAFSEQYPAPVYEGLEHCPHCGARMDGGDDDDA